VTVDPIETPTTTEVLAAMMVAVRITLDRKRPCLACGAPWRVRSTAIAAGQSDGGPGLWDERGGQCSARCWESDASRYLDGVRERRSRGWDPDDTSRCERQRVA
jgi:hypothetical protein